MAMDLPLVLAGPILRRVDPTSVSVWLAFSAKCDVRLRVFEGRAASGQPSPFVEGPVSSTLRVGTALHLVLVRAVLKPEDHRSFQSDTLYSYDVEVNPKDGPDAGRTFNLQSLGLLENVEPTDGAGARLVPHVALGFEPGLLPSFAPPPSRLEDLNLLYGSCRRPGHEDPDALAMVDDLIFGDDRYKDPRARPHQLFLGGDQIYADDVTPQHMLLLLDVANRLIGFDDPDPQVAGPIEHIRLDTILIKDESTQVDPDDPAAAYQTEPAERTAADPDLPVDRMRFPEERRLSLTRRDAQLTSEDGESHVISLGEFAALYLSVWSNAVWGLDVPGVRYAPDKTKPGDSRPLSWDDEVTEQGAIIMPPVIFPERIAGHLYVAPDWKSETNPDRRAEGERKWRKQLADEAEDRPKKLREAFQVIQGFRKALPKVQRVLANVPTYMILDDHDATDDYFLNPMWRDRVLTTQLGQAILRNAMVSYALFQDWGNVPDAYASGPRAQLLELIPQMFAPDATNGPDQLVCDQIAHLLGHDLRNTPNALGRYDPVKPPILGHFTVDGPRHRVVAFDNRTRRSYGSRNGPPGNVSVEALLDQLPLPPLPAGQEILIVLAPLQVIGPPVLDEIVAPLAYRAFDAVEAGTRYTNLRPESTTGLRQMLGTNPDAIETWAFDSVTYEHLLARLAPYRRVVLLSGDVHYGAGALMSYWRGAETAPARFAQFTSSGFKNVMPRFVTFVDRSLGFAQQLIRANLGFERVAWSQPAEDLVLLPEGVTELDLVPVMRTRLRTVPVLLPTWGWPDRNDPDEPHDESRASRLNPARPPEWRWRVRPLLDQRTDAERPASVRPLPIDEATIDAQLASPDTILEAYTAIAIRHQHAMNRLRNARQILFRANVGRVRFEPREGGGLDAVHELYTTFTDPDQPAVGDPRPEAFLVQVARLGPEDEAPPETLRQKVLEVNAPGGAG